MIVFDHVTKMFGDSAALDDVTFTIEPGEFVFIQGHSGAGKTTLSKLILREYLPTAGEIFVGEFQLSKLKNSEIPNYRQQIGMVFQDFKLLSQRTAAENIALALEIMNKPDHIIGATVNELLKVTGLEGKGNLFPRQLSGGEMQRVVIARALATEPAVLFADEPTGNLDQETAEQIVDLLERINEAGTTVVMATHNHDIIHAKKRRTITLKHGKVAHDTKAPKKHEHDKHDTKKEEKRHHHVEVERVGAHDDLVRNAEE